MTDQSVTSMTSPNLADGARRRAPDERPQQIIDAALQVFGERGLAGARLEDIARLAGIAKGTIYLYFPNKEALFREVIQQTIVARIAEAEGDLQRDDRSSAVEQLTRYMRGWWEFLVSDAFQIDYRLVVGELHRFPDVYQFYVTEVVQRAHGLVARIVARGIERREFRPVDVDTAARMLAKLPISEALWYGSRHRVGNAVPLSSHEVRDQVIDFALHALRPAGAASPATSPTPAPSDAEPHDSGSTARTNA